MRAGLLADPEVISRLSKNFICTSMIIDDLEKKSAQGSTLAKELLAQWEYPVEFIFLSPEGKFVSKLNSAKDFPGMHPDVAAPKATDYSPLKNEHGHIERFLEHLARHFH